MIGELVAVISAACAGGFVGNINGYFVGRKVKNSDLIALLPQTAVADITSGALWCLCGSPMSMHKNKSGACQDYVRNPKGNFINHPVHGYPLRCSCQAFVGDPDRNPAPKGELEL